MTTPTKKTNPFEAELNSELNTLHQQTKHNAKTDAELGSPQPTGDQLQPYVSYIYNTCQSLLDKQASVLKPQSTLHSTITNNKEAQLELRELLNKKAEALQQKNKLTSTLNNTPQPPKYQNRKWILLAIISLSLFEASFSINLFESWGFTKLESLILSPLFAAVFALIAHMTPKLIFLIQKPKHKKWAIGGLIVLFTIAFTYLGRERASFLTAHTGYSHSAIPFVILSLLLLITATLLSYFYLPVTTEEKEAIESYDQLKQTQQQAVAECQNLEQEIQHLKQQRITTEELSAITLEEGSMNELRILNSAQACIALYITTNKKHREIPSDCYTQTVDFQFRTHFLPLFDTHSNTNNSSNHQNTNSNENAYTI